MSDSFPSSFSYSRSSTQDSSSTANKEPLRKVSSDAKADSDSVWKRAPGGPLSRQASDGGVGKYGTTRQPSTDGGKGKIFTRQLSKGVSEQSLKRVAFLLR